MFALMFGGKLVYPTRASRNNQGEPTLSIRAMISIYNITLIYLSSKNLEWNGLYDAEFLFVKNNNLQVHENEEYVP